MVVGATGPKWRSWRRPMTIVPAQVLPILPTATMPKPQVSVGYCLWSISYSQSSNDALYCSRLLLVVLCLLRQISWFWYYCFGCFLWWPCVRKNTKSVGWWNAVSNSRRVYPYGIEFGSSVCMVIEARWLIFSYEKNLKVFQVWCLLLKGACKNNF